MSYVLLILAFWVAHRIFFRIISVDRYEYLNLLSFAEWRSGREIRLEMQRQKKGRINLASFYKCMSQLEGEGLIEREMISEEVDGEEIRTAFYRKKPGGNKSKKPDLKDPASLSPAIA